MKWGVRSRITLLATTVVLVVLAATGVSLVAAQRAVLTEGIDEVLLRDGAEIERLIGGGLIDDGPIDEGQPPIVIPGRGDEESFAQIQDGNGRVVAETSYLPEGVAATSPVSANAATSSSVRFETVRFSPNGSEYRMLRQPDGAFVVIVGTPLDDVQESVSTLTNGLLIAVPAAALLLAGLVWLLVGRVLRPVEDIRLRVAEISGSSLDRRVPEPRGSDEISRLAKTMNEMLDRVESSSESQRRFVADASHELRSPLTRMRAALEVDLAHPETADLAATRGDALEEVVALQSLVEDLLILARKDGAVLPVRVDPVDLDDVVMGEAERLGESRGVFDLSGVSAAQVVGDRAQLGRVVRNLFDNALRHARTRVTVTLAEVGGEALLTVADDGPGVSPDLREHIFERFARADESRNASIGGTGLGLAIVRELVDGHHGTVTLEGNVPTGARFVVRLPLDGCQGRDAE